MTRLRHILATPFLLMGAVFIGVGQLIYGKGILDYMLNARNLSKEEFKHHLENHL